MSDVEIFIDRIIEHLERVVREETEVLDDNQIADLREYNMRKSQGLYSLNRALRAPNQSLAPATLEKLQSLRATLQANEVALSRHLQAVREVATLISEAIRELESDGTYDVPPKRPSGVGE